MSAMVVLRVPNRRIDWAAPARMPALARDMLLPARVRVPRRSAYDDGWLIDGTSLVELDTGGSGVHLSVAVRSRSRVASLCGTRPVALASDRRENHPAADGPADCSPGCLRHRRPGYRECPRGCCEHRQPSADRLRGQRDGDRE